jgi:hypothetical protein
MQIPMHHESAVKQVASVLHLVLGVRKKDDNPIPHGTILTSSDILKAITNHLYPEVVEPYKETELSNEELTNVTRYKFTMQMSCLVSHTFTWCILFLVNEASVMAF